MRRLLAWMGRHGTALSAASIFIGLATPDLAALVRPWLASLVTVMLALAFLMIDPAAVAATLRRPRPILAGALVLAVATPLAFRLAGPIFDPLLGPGLTLALFIFAFGPPTLSSPAFAALMGLDGAQALTLCLALTLASPLVVPAVAGLIGVDFPLDAARLALRLAAIVLPAAAAAAIVIVLAGRDRILRNREAVTGTLIVPLAIFAVGSMDGITAKVAAEPLHMAGILLFGIALAVGGILATSLVLWPAGRSSALALGWCGGNRNLGLLVGAMSGSLPDDTWSYFAMAQFPIYALPLVAGRVYRVLLRRAPR
ncbi:sodium:proton symporter [Prosthecomicrobium sp. N25]|uniref:sodium:proton symporter n=1 Tax=Prosthecomicrobium sp. N25 TaxID=3129254 RepID=UPI0030773848